MRGQPTQSRNWLIFLVSLIIVSLVAVLAVAVWTGRATTKGPLPPEAFVQLDPAAGEPGTIVTVTGGGWQVGETVLVYLVEAKSGSSDGVIYGSAVAGPDGQIAADFRYPQAGPWVDQQSVIVSVRGVTSGRQARAAFQVLQTTAEPTTEPDTPTPQPATDTPTPEPPLPATDTPVPATETPAPLPPSETPTPVPPTATPTPLPPTATPKPPAPTPTPVRITEWRGEYYDNVNLAGVPRVRNDVKIDFDWGQGSPMTGVKTDGFSARWTRRLDFEAKTYRFHVRVDDGARLWVDGQLLIDQWHDSSPRTYSVERAMTGGQHDVRLEMYERSGGATMAFWRETVESYPDWKAEYFDNAGLRGAPRLVRNDKAIDLNWGADAPAPGLPADNFSVRWTRQLHFGAGTYRFFAEVDDGVRLWVDGILVIDQWRDGVGSYSGDLNLGEGKHTVRMEMYEHTGGAMARLWWTQPQQGYPQWKGEYFANRKLSGTPVLVRNDGNIDFNWGAGAPAAGLPADNFSVRWTRQLHFGAGTYRFFAEVDDGVRLWVDGILVIDQWRDGVGSYSGDFYLAEGKHKVQMEMYERAGNAAAHLWWTQVEGNGEWKGKYFDNRKLQGKAVLVRQDANIDFNWGTGSPDPELPEDGFSVKWVRFMDFSGSTYRFCAKADDGVSVEMDDKVPYIIRQWHDGSGTYCADVPVTAGRHKVTVEYYEHKGGALIQFWWQKL